MCERTEEMEGRTTSQKVVLSQNGKETVPRGKGQWRGRGRRGQNHYGRPTNSEYHRQQPSDRRDGYNQPQRWATMPQKRPQTRGLYQGRRDLSKEVESGIPVTTSSSGSKKYGSSLNHLLNFHYIPREKSVGYQLRTNRKSYTPFNKEQFIQANFQFVVCDSGDYTVHIVDPDVLVDWTLIEQVRIYSHEMPSCPICLYPPVAAKITRCGHIYCWSCMLHYLSLTDKSWHKCPICYEAVHKKDLKSVVTMESHPFAVGETITMRLMKRAKNSVLAIPKEQWRDRELKPFTVNDKMDTRCGKLLLASSEDVLRQIVFPEKTALETQLMEAKSEQSGEVCYIEAAIQEIKERHDSLSDTKAFAEEAKTLVKNVLDDQEKGADKCCGVTTWKVLSPNAIQDVNEYEAAFSDEEDKTIKPIDALDNVPGSVSEESNLVFSPEESNVTVDGFCGGCNSESTQEGTSENNSGDSSSESSRPLSPLPLPAQYYYFYQADDGQNIFLSSINARCLAKEYGSLANCPDYVTGQIVEMEAMSQSEGLRKRYRYLSHLPLTCEFVICELDLKPPAVSRATLDFYREELQHRKQQRQRKMRMEKKREQKLIASGTSGSSGRSSGNSGRSSGRGFVGEKLDLASEVEFPAQSGGQLALSPPHSGATTPSPFMQFAASLAAYQDEGNEAPVDSERANQYAENLSASPPSFAEALRSSKGIDIPQRVETRPRETVQVEKLGPGEEDENDDDCVPVPTFQSAFSDALVAADWTKREVHAQGASLEQSGGKKQKKTKKKLLFTTGSFMKYT